MFNHAPLSDRQLLRIQAHHTSASCDRKGFAQDHDTLVSEEQWVKASANLIREIGAEKFLRLLLENLKGNYCQ